MQYAHIVVRLGDEAMPRLAEALTGGDDDVLLAVEKAIQSRLGIEADETGDPYSDPLGVFVESLEDVHGFIIEAER